MATTRKSNGGSRRTTGTTITARGKNRNSSTGGSRSTSTSRAKSSTAKSRSGASAREQAGGYAGGFIEAIKSRPLTTAAIAGVAASAGAFLFAKRAAVGEQVSNLTDKVSEVSGKLVGSDDSADQSPLTGMDSASEAKSQRMSSGRRSRKSQTDIANEALSLKQSGDSSTVPDQSQVGAIAY
ncbi:hypothetical protein HMF7854_08290 [Sphingomonas ginkgonis]|uniref:Uncharacterized protein n=1 Tax=Sphingomonas ginkgonis TaxID=2315330 RepID=A0A429VAJ7_9SPHN|nr:hypothetical protein [Sphingomonas ginkgonis]RST30837.1 hypothetical protein HMF7854_08290 [Sphingomonas ginkgonis]